MKLGVKGKKALSIAKKGVVIAGALGAIAGIGSKGSHKIEEKAQQVEDTVEAGKVLGGAVVDIGKGAAKDVAANPLQAKKVVDKSKQMVVGIGAAAKKDPVGAAAQVKFAKAPKTTGAVNIKGATAYDRPDPSGKVIDRGGFSSASGGGDIRVCDTKYKGQPNQKRKCKKRVRKGGMP